MEVFSQAGQNAMKENDIELSDVSSFKEEDILDLFKSFKDRMVARQIVHVQKPDLANKRSVLELQSDSTCTSISSESADETGSDNDITNTSTASSETSTFTVHKLLENKLLRTKSSKAQQYFNGLVKDAATAARIWKNPVPLSDISDKKKLTFHAYIEDHVPDLKNKREKVWTRLGQHLQNRRKYIKDKADGKRTPKRTPKQSIGGTRHSEENDTGCIFKPGEIVTIVNKNSDKLGTGIFLAQKDMFSDIVIKKIDIVETDNIELPDSGSKFEEKRLVTYWTKRLQKTSVKRKICRRTSPCSDTNTEDTDTDEGNRNKTGQRKKTKNSEKDEVHVGKTDKAEPKRLITYWTKRLQKTSVKRNIICSASCTDTNTEDTDTCTDESNRNNKVNKTGQKRKTTSSEIVTPISSYRKQRSDSTTQGRPKKQKTVALSGNTPSSSKNKNIDEEQEIAYRNFVLMEWDKGALYWGIERGPDLNLTNDILIQNCCKPCTTVALGKGVSDDELVPAGGSATLNPADIQHNPDLRYRILKLRKQNNMITLVPSSINKSRAEIHVLSRELLINEVRTKLSAYINDTTAVGP